MIKVSDEKKLVVVLPSCLGTQFPPEWNSVGQFRGINMEDMPFYRHDYTRAVMVAHPAAYLPMWWRREGQAGFAGWVRDTVAEENYPTPFCDEIVGAQGLVEADIFLDMSQVAGWRSGFERRYCLKSCSIEEIKMAVDLDSMGLEPSEGAEFHSIYGKDIELMNSMEGLPFVVA